MKPFSASEDTGKPSNRLKIAVTFPSAKGLGPVACRRMKERFEVASGAPTKQRIKKAIAALEGLGFKVSKEGAMTVSVRATRRQFERAFHTKLTTHKASGAGSFHYPADDAPWQANSAIEDLIDETYIQWPHIYMNQRFDRGAPSPLVPRVDYHHLSPGDVSVLLGADRVHREGVTGRGVRVAMIDSGFAHDHPYFVERGYRTQTVLAPGANRVNDDGNGHGTGESANLLAVAPDVEFTGVKVDNETNPGNGASLLEGFQEALTHNPQVISVSLGFDLRSGATGQPLTSLPNGLIALETEIENAVQSGIVVVFSAGNGHISFPGQMPDVLSAGGVFVDPFGAMEASNYASAFRSAIYAGRDVPDCSGLVGRSANGASYITLPIPANCEIEVDGSMVNGTQPNDGYGVFSGTSAAAPQLAGACALLFERNPGLTPGDVRNALVQSARGVVLGSASAASNPGGRALRGAAATGGGLVDVGAALQLV